MPEENYRIRQNDLVPALLIGKHNIVVAGVGAVGRPVALQLACMGARRLRLVDPDKVEDVNVGTQMFTPQDIGANKVDVTWERCKKWMTASGLAGCPTYVDKFQDVF